MDQQEEELELNLEEQATGEEPQGAAGEEGQQAQPQASAEPPWTQFGEVLERLANRPEPAGPQPTPQGPSAEQLKAINEKLAGEILVNPLGVIMAVAQDVANEKVENLRRQVDPFRDDAAEAFVDRFKTKMREDDPLYKQVHAAFDKSLTDVDLRALSSQPAGARAKTLNLHWNAAKGEVLATKVRKAGGAGPPPGSSAGNGRTMAQPQGGAQKLGEQEKAMLYRSMPKAAADAAIAEIEAGMGASA